MEIVSVGPNKFNKQELTKASELHYNRIIYSYEEYPYEGYGVLVGFNEDSSLDIFSLVHCECRGPIEPSDLPQSSMSVSEYLVKYLNSEDPIDGYRKIAEYLYKEISQ